MSRKKNRHPIFEKLEIIDIAAEGKAIARKEDMVVFVSGCIPGDIVDVRISSKKKKFAEGSAVFFHTLSPLRIDPFCEHFGTCGGCKWQSLPYDKQLEFKANQVVDQLSRIGHLQLPAIEPIMGSVKTKFYRNKLEYTFSNLKWLSKEDLHKETKSENRNALGFHIPGMFDRILDINQCYLQAEPSNSIRLFVKKIADDSDYAFYNQRTHEGLFKNLIIRTSSIGETMVILVVSENKPDFISGMMNKIYEQFPSITSLNYVINPKRNDTIFDLDVVLFKGKPFILEQMEDLQFRIGPKSFYQTNSEQAYELYKTVRKFADLQGNETVYDLYTGTGTIALFLAKYCKEIIGIESIPDAIQDAKQNAVLNGISNAHFYAGDAKNLLPEMLRLHQKPDVLITDPPRAGMHLDVIESILLANPEKIVYVSCNPATQARDLALLSEKYSIHQVQPVDMFPHTHHVENVVLLKKKF
jgi:23S rRNA (uracil1939-C5)-methyltransferase